jgi:predicted transcriptional regulator
MKRSKEEIIKDILEVCKGPSSKTTIVYRANTNFKKVDYYLSILINAGLLEASGTERVNYKTTQKGLEFLEHIKAANALSRPYDNHS